MELPDKTQVQASNRVEGELCEGAVLCGKYVIERELGRGGMGIVYLAMHQSLRRLVAIKTIPPSLVEQETFVERFKREAKTLASIRHANIVSVTDFDTDRGHLFLVLDYVNGGTLADYCKEKGEIGLSSNEVSRILCEILAGLAHAHRAGIIHRDLKPANIMMEKTGEPRISDFGLARVVKDICQNTQIEQSFAASHNSATSNYVGTAEFMAPEVKQGKPADRRSDLYAMGVITYWLLTGKKPGAMAIPVSKLVKSEKLSSDWDKLIARALSEDPEHRFASAEEMMKAIKEIRTSKTSVSLRTGLLLVCMVLAGAGTYWSYSEPEVPTNSTASGKNVTQKRSAIEANKNAPVEYRSYRISGLPAGAQLVTGGQKVLADAKGSLSVSIQAVAQTARITAHGFESWQGMLGLPDQPDDLKIELVKVRPRAIKILGLPPGALVIIDQARKAVQAGQDTSFDLIPGQVHVSVQAKGFVPLDKSLELPEDSRELSLAIEKIPPPAQVSITLKGGTKLTFLRIAPGDFQAGSSNDEQGRQRSDENSTPVHIAKAFYMAETELTQAQWTALMGSNPSASRALRDGSRPVEQVGWLLLEQKETGLLARLATVLKDEGLAYEPDIPSEHEWEYACRAGSKGSYCFSSGMENDTSATTLGKFAVFGRNSDSAPGKVASHKPNAWGLHDMHGNVAEWTRGIHGTPVLRGGDWRALSSACRASSRVEIGAEIRPTDTMGVRLILRPLEE